MTAGYQGLVTKWREFAMKWHGESANNAIETCADELAEEIAKHQVSADWIRKAAIEIVGDEYGISYESVEEQFAYKVRNVAEVIARNVQPSPELDDDDPVEAMERCIGIDPPRARPVQRSPGDAHSHVSEVLAEATRLGFSAHDNSWKQLGAIIEDALESYATKTRGVKR